MELTIVTAASSNHFRPLLNLLWTIRHFEPKTKAVVYDLGLHNEERGAVIGTGYDLRPFPFFAYPDWVRDLMKYAWKAACVDMVAAETGDEAAVLWCDAGDLFAGAAMKVRRVIERQGFYCPLDFGTLGGWTHPDTRAAMNMSALEEDLPMRSTALCGVHMRLRGLVEEWKQWSLREEVIAPPGSSKRNHRHDMSIFTLLADRWAGSIGNGESDWFEVTKHHDDLTLEKVQDRAQRGVPYKQESDSWPGLL